MKIKIEKKKYKKKMQKNMYNTNEDRRMDIHVFCWSGQSPVVDYKLGQDDPVGKEASYWYCVPKH